MANGCNRREFLRLLSAAPVAAAAASGPRCGGVDPAPTADVPPVTESGSVTFAPARFPSLAKVGGALTIRSSGLALPLLVVRTGEAEFSVVSSRCTHQGCPVGFSETAQAVECPCHGARFSLEGKVLRGPAASALQAYPARFDTLTQDLVIDTRARDSVLPEARDGTITLSLPDYPALQAPGGSLVGSPIGLGFSIVVAHLADGTFAAVEATCTHQGCLLAFDAGTERLRCPCHGSTFELSGSVSTPPATIDLRAFTATVSGDVLTISL